MSRYERWSVGIAFVSAVITIAGFWFLWLQLRSTNESLRAGAYSNMSSWTFDLDKAFLQYPELRPYFYAGKDIREDDPLFLRAQTMAEFLLDNFDSIMEFDRQYPGTLHAGWRDWIYESFNRSPLLVRTLENRKAEYESGPAWKIYLQWKHDHPQTRAQ